MIIENENQLGVDSKIAEKVKGLYSRKSSEINKFYTLNKVWASQQFELEFTNIKFGNYYNLNLDDFEKNKIDSKLLMEKINLLFNTIESFEKVYDDLFFKNDSDVNIKKLKSKLGSSSVDIVEHRLYSIFLRRELYLFKYFIFIREDLVHIDDELEDNYFKIYENYDLFKQTIYDEINLINFDKVKNYENLIQIHLCYEKSIIEYYNNNSPHKLSNVTSTLFILFIIHIFDSLKSNLNSLKTSSTNEIISAFYLNLSNLKDVSRLFHISFKVNSNDLMNLSEYSEEWIKIKEVYERRIYYTRHSMLNSLNKLFEKIENDYVSILKAYDYQDLNISKFDNLFIPNVLLRSFLYYFYSSKAKYEYSKYLLTNKCIITGIRRYFNHNIINHLHKMKLTRIKWSRKIYLKRTMPIINLELINKLIESIEDDYSILSGITSLDSGLKRIISEYGKPLSLYSELSDEDILVNYHYNAISNTDLYLKEISDKEIKSKYVKIRLISPSRHKIPNISGNHSFWGVFNFLTPSKLLTYPNSLIIHINSDSFTFSTHEIYTRKWAKTLGIPLISIHYSVNSYPEALDELFQAYMWIINHSEEEFGIKTKKIVLVGNSFGGGLALALVYLLILLKKRLPDGIVLGYPCKL